MKRVIVVWIVIIMMVMGGMIGFLNLSTNAENGNGDDDETRSASQSKSGITAHDPIEINGDGVFAWQSSSEGWSGDGTEGTPYIIENYDINASTAHGISIKNTDVHFIIRNCIIHEGKGLGSGYSDDKYGIYFYKVRNGKIDNITSYNNEVGILLDGSSNNNIITNCKVHDNHYGILLYYPSNNQITNCDVYNNGYYGIWLKQSSNNQITNCNVYNNSGGIYLMSSSNNEIHYCNIYNCGVYNYNYVVNATYNWWGSSDGPSGAGPGTGSAVTSNVLYDPWLLEPVEDAGWMPSEGEEEGGEEEGAGEEEEGEPPAKPSEITWPYIIIPVIIIVVVAGMGLCIKHKKRRIPEQPV